MKKFAVLIFIVFFSLLILTPPLYSLTYSQKLNKYLSDLKNPDVNIRISAIQNLTWLRDELSIPPLIKILKTDPSNKVRKEAAYALGSAGDETVVDTLLETALNSKDLDIQKESIISLSYIKNPKREETINKLSSLLKDKNAAIRKQTAIVLARLNAKSQLNSIIALLNDKDEEAVRGAIEALSYFNNRESLNALISAFNKNKNLIIREDIINSLGYLMDFKEARKVIINTAKSSKGQKIKNTAVNKLVYYISSYPDVLKGLLAIFKGLDNSNLQYSIASSFSWIYIEEDLKVAKATLRECLSSSRISTRFYSIDLLASLNDQESIGKILYCLNDSSSIVRAKAIESLGKLKASNSTKEIMEKLNDNDLEIKTNSIEALGRLKDKNSRGIIIKILESSNNIECKKAAINSLTHLYNNDVLHIYKNSLEKEEDNSVKIEIIKAFGIVKDPLAVPLIIAFLKKNNSSDMLNESIYTLGLIGDKKAIPFLLSLSSKTKDHLHKYRIMTALNNMKDPSLINFLIKTLQDESYFVREYAAYMLKDLNITTYKSELGKILKSSNEETRELACKMLSDLNDKTISNYFIPLLKDPNKNIRISASKVFVRFPSQKAVNNLINNLNDPYSTVRVNSLTAIAKTGYKKASFSLLKLLKDPYEEVRLNAAWAIGQLRDESILPELKKLLTHPSAEVKKAAETAYKSFSLPDIDNN